MVFHSKYEIEDLTEIIKELAIEALNVGQSRFSAVTKKFATSKLMRASTFVQNKLKVLQHIISESSQWCVFTEQCLVWDLQLCSLPAIDSSKICLKGILISDVRILPKIRVFLDDF